MLGRDYTVREYAAKTYAFYFKPYGWANFTLNETTGEFNIQSDWGDYQFRWSPSNLGTTGDSPLLKFIASASPYYIADKFSYNKPRTFKKEFDIIGTEKNLREIILRMRRENEITKFQANHCWTDVNHLFKYEMTEYSDPEYQSYVLYNNIPDSLIDYKVIEDFSELFVYKTSKEYDFCVNELLPFFQSFLKEKVL